MSYSNILGLELTPVVTGCDSFTRSSLLEYLAFLMFALNVLNAHSWLHELNHQQQLEGVKTSLIFVTTG